LFDIKDFIPKRILQLRTARGITAKDMSLLIGQGSGFISNIENLKALPAYDKLVLICDYFGITVSEFFDEGNHHPEFAKPIMDELRTLDAQQLETVLAVIRGFKK